MNTTTKAAHTPGPWTAGFKGEFETHNPNIVYANDGADSICQIYGVPMNCTMEDLQRSNNSSDTEGMANASLIAAAPEMLDLLEAYLRGDYNDAAVGLVAAFDEAVHALVYRIHGDTGQGLDTPLSGEAAIQKARGGQ